MKKQHQLLFVWAFLIVCILIGGFLGLYLIGKEMGEYPYDLVAPMIGGVLIGIGVTLIFMFLRKKRKTNLPQFDERSIVLFKRYFIVVLYVVMIGCGAALVVLYANGIDKIETGMLIVFMGALYVLIILGALVMKILF
ncbi:hypothetical protein [Radiobacillus sp. PE A8.2]|uniref:hypothetical protein n=1 Tax=Radiobacillus sp. PE A8.2 TaxID=3380349 RepID=UPI00388F53FB